MTGVSLDVPGRRRVSEEEGHIQTEGDDETHVQESDHHHVPTLTDLLITSTASTASTTPSSSTRSMASLDMENWRLELVRVEAHDHFPLSHHLEL